jgi:hypothetical protein
MKVQTGRMLALASAVAVAAAVYTFDVRPTSAAVATQLGDLAPTLVASHVRARRALEPAPGYGYDGQIWTQRPGYATVPPSGCYEDEGYGRYTPCDAGGGS